MSFYQNALARMAAPYGRTDGRESVDGNPAAFHLPLMVRGRQVLLMMHEYFSTNIKHGATYSLSDLFNVRMEGDNLKTFLTNWDSVTTLTLTHSPTLTLTHTHSHSHPHSLTHLHSHSHSLSLSLRLSLSDPHSLTLALTLALALTLTHSPTLTHTHLQWTRMRYGVQQNSNSILNAVWCATQQ